MKNKIIKYLLSIFAAFVFLFSVSSCGNENKYLEGGTCGDATVEGTNAFSKIRVAYCEQFVYDYNLSLVEEGKTYAQFKEVYQQKYVLNENNLEQVAVDDDKYIQAHYLFTFMDATKADNSLVETYVRQNVSEPNDYLNLLNICAYGETDNADVLTDVKYGYFEKVSHQEYDADEVNGVLSVKNRMSAHSKACIVFEDDFIDPATGVNIPKMSYGEAWKIGFFTGLLVYPMSWLINVFVRWFGGTGWSIVFAIIVVTLILKLLILLITFKSQASTQKMQDIQPEVAAIQAKYGPTPDPNAKQRMAMEMMAVYKKYGVKPFAPFISLLITFPVFIAMYRAVMYLGVLRTGSINGVVLGNNLNTYIIGNFNYVALLIFLFMAVSQILSMKLPQIISRRRMSPEARARQKEAGKSMSMMSNVMMIMILVMGFFMPVTMSIYWVASAIVGVLQSIIMHNLNNANRGKSGRYKVKKVEEVHAQIPKGRRV